jgi:hypothetical protein
MRSTTSAEQLNAGCFCITLDRAALFAALDEEVGEAAFSATHLASRPNLFSNVPAFVPAAALSKMLRVVSAIEATTKLPTYRAEILSRAPAIAAVDHGPRGAFMGYDFHLGADGPRLIEVNTNAGGAFLNALLMRAQRACCPEVADTVDGALAEGFEATALAMFQSEWRALCGEGPLRRVAIVDERPEEQYLYPEFLLAQRWLERAGIETVIVDAGELGFDGNRLLAHGTPVDLVYNRLTDFYFEKPEHAALRAAYGHGAVVVTPNPHLHALFADKRNLTLLSDPATLDAWGVSAEIRVALDSVPRTVLVTKDNAESLWRSRKDWFFKPTAGHGGKAVYRGDKLTRGVWSNILEGSYVAQAFAAPGSRTVQHEGVETRCKMDVRLYTYDGRLLLMAARLYQGQTTNFRTAGGGFAPIYVV